ncbi:MAG: AAA family ATPase [Rhodospirillales bacterium]
MIAYTVNRAELRLYEDGAPVAVSLSALRLAAGADGSPGCRGHQGRIDDTHLGFVAGQRERAARSNGRAAPRGRQPPDRDQNPAWATGSQARSRIWRRRAGRRRQPGIAAPGSAAPPPCVRRTPHPALLGRDAQLRDVADALARSRFITLTGPGGVGKTSLARALAQQTSGDFPRWRLVRGAGTAARFGRRHRHAARRAERAIRFAAPSLGDLQAHLQPKRALLVLDNCEHVLHAASYLAAALYAGAPQFKHCCHQPAGPGLRREHVIHVLPLALPDAGVNSLRHARRSPAFRLFMDRINALDPRFRLDDEQVPTVVRICRSLDGLPLTRMVAGWAGALGLEALEKKLDASPARPDPCARDGDGSRPCRPPT